jgi:regulator of replication initiation timing
LLRQLFNFKEEKIMDVKAEIIEAEEVRTPETIAIEIKAAVNLIQKQIILTVESIGQKLIEAKELVPYGEWKKYLNEQVHFSERTAQTYMKIASSDPETLRTAETADLSISNTLRLIALSDDDQKELASAVESGEVAPEDVSAEIEKYKARIEELEDLELENTDLIEERSLLHIEVDELKEKLKDAAAKADAAAQKKIDKAVADAKKELEEKAATASAEELDKLKTGLASAESRAVDAEKKCALSSSTALAEMSIILRNIISEVDAAAKLIAATDEETALKWRKAVWSALSDAADKIGQTTGFPQAMIQRSAV